VKETRLPSGLYLAEDEPQPAAAASAGPVITCAGCRATTAEPAPFLFHRSAAGWTRHNWTCKHGAEYACPACEAKAACSKCGRQEEYT
jgi:hypothetical protein